MPREILDKDKEETKFVNFLLDNEFVIEDFVKTAKKNGFELDLSESSLDILEAYYLSKEAEFNNDEEKKDFFIEAAARYLGAALIKNYGGAWTLSIDDPKDLYYGLPVITGHSKYDIEFCPHETFRMFTRKKKLGFIRKVIQNDINPVSKLDDLKPE